MEHPSVLVGNAGFRRLLWSRRGLPLPRLSPLLRGRSVRGAGQARDRANQGGRRQITAGDRTGARRTRRPHGSWREVDCDASQRSRAPSRFEVAVSLPPAVVSALIESGIGLKRQNGALGQFLPNATQRSAKGKKAPSSAEEVR